jgi:hypothetical protein
MNKTMRKSGRALERGRLGGTEGLPTNLKEEWLAPTSLRSFFHALLRGPHLRTPH